MSQTDYKNIEALRYLVVNFSKEVLATMQALHISNEKIAEFPDVQVFAMFANVKDFSVTFCSFPVFPSKTIAQAMPKIVKLNLEGCNISVVKTLRPLGVLSDLKELNLSSNPILLDRSSVLKSLLFYKNHTGEVLTPSPPIKRAYTLSRLILSKSKPTVVPRPPPFPMLLILNTVVIKEDEINTVMPSTTSQLSVKYTDRVIEKVRRKNTEILEHKAKYSSMKALINPYKAQTSRNPHINTLEFIKSHKVSIKLLQTQESPLPSHAESTPPLSSRKSLRKTTEKFKVPSKEKMQDFLKQNKITREKANLPIPQKVFEFDEVSRFMYGKSVRDTGEVHAVCEVMSIVNGVKKNFGISELEINKRLSENKMNMEELEAYQEIMLLDDDMKNLRLKNAYFEWWLKKLEKKHIDFAEHQAILALHNNKIFNNPLLDAKVTVAPSKKKIILADKKPKPLTSNRSVKRTLLPQEEHKNVTLDFASLFSPTEITEGPSIFIEPIQQFEKFLNSLQSKMKEKEREYENLNTNGKVLWKLDKIKKNIQDRKAVREKLISLYNSVQVLKKKFFENEQEYFYNIHEKKLNYHEVLKRHDFLPFPLPKFTFPLSP